jgi:protein O-GlcNAc transferase
MDPAIDKALQEGIAAQNEGRLDVAAQLYRAILQAHPAHADANHNLGILAVTVGQAEEALFLFKTALQTSPQTEQFWLSYIDCLIKTSSFDEAIQALDDSDRAGVAQETLDVMRRQLASRDALVEDSANQHINCLLEHYQAGRLVDAEELAVSLTRELPNHPFAWKVLGAVLQQTGRLSQSETPMLKS